MRLVIRQVQAAHIDDIVLMMADEHHRRRHEAKDLDAWEKGDHAAHLVTATARRALLNARTESSKGLRWSATTSNTAPT